jgi:hypothetical protein
MVIGACAAGVWVGQGLWPSPTAPVWFLDRDVQHRSSPTADVPGYDITTAQDGCTLWMVSNSSLRRTASTITEIALAGS